MPGLCQPCWDCIIALGPAVLEQRLKPGRTGAGRESLRNCFTDFPMASRSAFVWCCFFSITCIARQLEESDKAHEYGNNPHRVQGGFAVTWGAFLESLTGTTHISCPAAPRAGSPHGIAGTSFPRQHPQCPVCSHHPRCARTGAPACSSRLLCIHLPVIDRSKNL